MSDHPTSPQRPTWAPVLERITLRVARWLGPLIGRPDEAHLTSMARADRWSPTAEPIRGGARHIKAGRAAFSDGRHGDALHHFGLAVEADDQNPWAWHGRGDALQLLERSDAALAAYDRAAALAPERAIHHAGRANALDTLQRTHESRAAWDRALALDPAITWMRE